MRHQVGKVQESLKVKIERTCNVQTDIQEILREFDQEMREEGFGVLLHTEIEK